MTTHLTTRLVWHDRAWDGHVCENPSKNTYCIVQQHIRDARDDDREDQAAGLPLDEIAGWHPPYQRLCNRRLGTYPFQFRIDSPIVNLGALTPSKDWDVPLYSHNLWWHHETHK